MTELIENFIDITYEIRRFVSNSSLVSANTTNLDLIQQTLSNDVLLAALANQTSLSIIYIKQTVRTVYSSAEQIQEVHEYLYNNRTPTFENLRRYVI